MKKTALFVILVFGMLFSSLSHAQYTPSFGGSKVILKSGDLKKMIGEKNIKLDYDYSNIKVGAFNSEAEYVDSKVKAYNEKEKGKGDTWKKGWEGARKERFQPKFEELFCKKLLKSGLVASEKASKTKYILIVKTTFIEPGYNVGIMKKPAFVNFEFLLVETDKPSVVVAELYLNNVVGSQSMGFDFDAGSRIAESYAKAGKMLGKFISKELKK
jgi:hypothetical protein